MLYIQYENDYDIMDEIVLVPNCTPSNKQLRLALDLVDVLFPLFRKLPAEDKVDALKDVLKISTTKEKLQKLTSHKDLLYKYVVTIKNKKIITKRVRKQ
jgi:hypothetical protein